VVTYTTPPDTAGEEPCPEENAPVGAVHRGAHVLGVPEHPEDPVASNAARVPVLPITYTRPDTTVGEVGTGEPIGAVHRGTQVVGVPEHPVDPAASNA
jgi:hypothetical protein